MGAGTGKQCKGRGSFEYGGGDGALQVHAERGNFNQTGMKKDENLALTYESRLKIAISNISRQPMREAAEIRFIHMKNGIDKFILTGYIPIWLFDLFGLYLQETSIRWLLTGEGNQESEAFIYKGLYDSSSEREKKLTKIIDTLNTELKGYRDGDNYRQKPANLKNGKIIKMNIR